MTGAGVWPVRLFAGLALTATDWTHGTGATVTGSSSALIINLSGRTAALGELAGPGVEQFHPAPRHDHALITTHRVVSRVLSRLVFRSAEPDASSGSWVGFPADWCSLEKAGRCWRD